MNFCCFHHQRTRRGRGFYFSFFLLALTFTSSFVFPSDSLTIYTEDFPPYSYQDSAGEIKGISTSVIRSLQERIGDKSKIKIAPWPEVFQKVLNESNILAFSMGRQKGREDKFYWLGEIAPNQVFFYKLTSRTDLNLNTFEEAKKYRIGVTREDARHQFFKNKGLRLGENLFLGKSHKSNLEKLLKKRIDLWPMPEYVALNLLKAKNLPKNSLRRVIRMPSDNLRHAGKYYLVASKKTDQKIVTKWKKALEEIHKSGLYDKIIEEELKLLDLTTE